MLFVEGRILSKLTGREILFSISYCNDYYTISSDLNIGIIKLRLALPATEIQRYSDTVTNSLLEVGQNSSATTNNQ